MQTEINNADFRALLGAEVPILGNYLVGFALPAKGTEDLNALPGGSGTLVSINGVDGILTAKHVLISLERNGIAGLILPSAGTPQLHHVSFEMEHCVQFVLPVEGEARASGPDLGFLIPPPNVLSTLRAKKSFLNLSKRQAEMLENPQPLDRGIWTLSGVSGEWTSDAPSERGFQRIKIFKGGLLEGKVTREFEQDGYDYLIFEALYNELYEGPQSFGGFSGGGLWQLLGQEKDGKFRITQRLLTGATFYQSDLKKDGEKITREITCHGRRSLYNVLLEHVRCKAG